jgi:hypothetical protein
MYFSLPCHPLKLLGHFLCHLAHFFGDGVLFSLLISTGELGSTASVTFLDVCTFEFCILLHCAVYLYSYAVNATILSDMTNTARNQYSKNYAEYYKIDTQHTPTVTTKGIYIYT